MIKPLNSLEEKIIWRARCALGPSLKAFDINHRSTGAVVMKATWQDGISGSFVVTEEEFYRVEEQVMYRVEAGLNELAEMSKKYAAEIERRLRAEADRMATPTATATTTNPNFGIF